MYWKLFADLAERADAREVAVDGDPTTVGDALEALLESHPALRERVLDADGALAPDINVLVNGENVHGRGGMDMVIEEGDELALFPPVSGG